MNGLSPSDPAEASGRSIGVPLVAQLVNPLPWHPERPTSSLIQLTACHIEAIKLAKAVMKEGADSSLAPLTLRALSNLADAAFRAYCACDRPVRSDLLAEICEMLAVAMLHFNAYTIDPGRTYRVMSSIGLIATYPVDPVESVVVLGTDLHSNSGFASAALAARITRALREILLVMPPASSEQYVEHISSLLGSLIAVATSSLYPRGFGHVAPDVGPPGARLSSVFEDSGVSVTVVYRPHMSCSLSFAKEGLSVALDRDTVRTLMAIFVGDPGLVLQRYNSVGLIGPKRGQQAQLRIFNLASVDCPMSRFRAIQRLCSRMLLDSDYQAWIDYRTSLFGDL